MTTASHLNQVPYVYQPFTSLLQLVRSGTDDHFSSGITHVAAGILHLADTLHLRGFCHAAREKLTTTTARNDGCQVKSVGQHIQK